ncbi:DUF397 domain-containing protein [Streptomyces griseochromogenes]|uniref:DUF397 domain-containing protein n=1 Tax=Streptomyces griseochromogenes TaxID=68214 RepID=UPI0037950820
MASPSIHQWFKSSYSGGSGTECVECAWVGESAVVRDSKRPGPMIPVREAAWMAFLGTLKSPAAVSE